MTFRGSWSSFDLRTGSPIGELAGWRNALVVGVFAVTACLAGCQTAPTCAPPAPGCTPYQNPGLVPVANKDFVWDQLVDVVDDYFQIEREDRVRQVGNQLTVGRIDTVPEVGSTIFEPWRGDSVGAYQRVEATFQSIRRRALVQVVPAEGGFLVDVAVYKELEDLRAPELAATGRATVLGENSLDRFNDEAGAPGNTLQTQPPPDRAGGPTGPQPTTLGWIPQGRDPALEQRILSEVMARVGGPAPQYSGVIRLPVPE